MVPLAVMRHQAQLGNNAQAAAESGNGAEQLLAWLLWMGSVLHLWAIMWIMVMGMLLIHYARIRCEDAQMCV